MSRISLNELALKGKAKFLADVYPVKNYLSDKSYLSIDDYNAIFDFRHQQPAPFSITKYFILEHLYLEKFPSPSLKEVKYLKELIYARNDDRINVQLNKMKSKKVK